MKKIETFATRLDRLLDSKGLRQSDICEITGIGKSAMSQYLSGSFEPKQNNIYKISKALNVSEAWLMGYDVPAIRNASDFDTFNFYMDDNSMINSSIPSGALVVLDSFNSLEVGRIKPKAIVLCLIDNKKYLRHFEFINNNIILSASNPEFSTIVIPSNGKKIKIIGIAKQVIIDLQTS